MVVKAIKHHYGHLFLSKTMKTLSVLLSANILNAAIGFLTSVLVLRYVDKEIIAVIYPLISILMIVGQFGDFGLSNSFIKVASSLYHNEKKKSLQYFNAAFKLKLYLCILLTVVGIPMSGLIAKWTFGEEIHVGWVRLILIVTSIQIMSSYASSALQIEGKFNLLSLAKVVPNLIKMVMISILVWLNRADLNWIFWSFAIVPILTCLMTFVSSDRDPLFKIQSTKEQFSELFHVSKWIAISALSNAIMGQIDVLMLRSMSGADELNRFLGGQKLSSVFPILTVSIVTVLLPKVTSMKSKQELNYFFRKGFKIIIPLAIFMMMFLPLSKYFIPLILGPKYINSIDVFNIQMIANILGMIVTPFGLILYTLNRESTMAYLNIYQLIINIVGDYYWIQYGGAVGASWVTVIAKLLAVIMIYYVLYKENIMFYKEEKNEVEKENFN